MTIDPIALARFMVLQGAAELVDAFSAIPEGHLRASIVSHAQAIALTYDEARRSGAPIPDPLELALRNVRPRASAQPLTLPNGPPPRINGADTPTLPAQRHELKTLTPATTAVRLRLQGMSPPEIAAELEIDLGHVFDALKEARKAGVKFQALPKPPPGQRKASGNWNTDWATIPLTARGHIERAALAYSLDPQRYLELKATLLTLKLAGTPWPQIVQACQPIPENILWRWVYAARAAGHPVTTKMEDRAAEPGAPPLPSSPPLPRRFFPPFDELRGQDRAALVRAAARRGISLEVYDARRERILQLRMAGLSPTKIGKEVGEGPVTVKDIIAHARHRAGLDFPPIRRRVG